MLILLDVMGQVNALADKSNIDLQLVDKLLEMIFAYPGLKQYAKRIRTRDFDNMAFDFLSAFKDVQLILQASSYVHVPFSYANNVRVSVLQLLQMTWRKKTELAYMRLLLCLLD
jgi:3-hydroxyisobutyrate dehydrogenase-like beta-hydroxyacid dehydrogenase